MAEEQNDSQFVKYYICSDDKYTRIDGFYIFDYDVQPTSRVLGAPMEDGRTSFDHKVIDPKRIIINGEVIIAENTGADTKIREMFNNRSYKFYSVKLDGEEYNKLILQKATHKKSTERIDVVKYTLEYVEAMVVQSAGSSPSNSENSDTRASGFSSTTRVL